MTTMIISTFYIISSLYHRYFLPALITTFSTLPLLTLQYQHLCIAQMAGAVKYTDCFSAERKDSSNKHPRYDNKQSDGEVPVMLEFWGMWSTISLPLLLGPLWPRMVGSDRVLSMT